MDTEDAGEKLESFGQGRKRSNMDTVLSVIILLAVILGGIWLWGKIQDLFYRICDAVIRFFDGTPKKCSDNAKIDSHLIATIQELPEPLEAHDTLEAFCRIMHRLDIAMSPYCQYDGIASLAGGIDEQGRGYSYFWYDKDYAGVESVFHSIGYYSPDEHRVQSSDESQSDTGWSMQNGVVQYKSVSIIGYQEWMGYNTTYKQFGKDAAESSIQKMIEAVINNEWPEARITSYNGNIDTPSGERMRFSIRIRTTISAE